MAFDAFVVALYTTDAKDRQMISVDTVKAVARRGLVGDRYFEKTGYYSHVAGWGANVTLVQSEAIEAVNSGHNVEFTGAMLRRNILTKGIDLTKLIGKEFRCGSAILRGTKPFPPCAHLAYLLGKPEVLKYFAYCGGIGAEVVADGEIKLGDMLELIDSEFEQPNLQEPN